ncbi:uncharacterized protein [Oscarella lobularis]|uniref:uncharacterized protein n=1 Tax=Oscarella lobularis TaxID=121494 RepID=UPI0033140005
MRRTKQKFDERDSSGFKFARKAKQSKETLSPRSRRRKSCEFYARKGSSGIGVEEEKEKENPQLSVVASEVEENSAEIMIGKLREGVRLLAVRTQALEDEEKAWDHLKNVKKRELEEMAKKNWDKEFFDSDGFPVALTDDERSLLAGALPFQAIFDEVNEMRRKIGEMVFSLDIVTSKVEKIERTFGAYLEEEIKCTANRLRAPISPKTAVDGFIESGNSYSK